MKQVDGRRRGCAGFGLAVALSLAPAAPAGILPGAGAQGAPGSPDGLRDPLGVVRTTTRPRVWILFDTSESMELAMGNGSRLAAAQDVVRSVVRDLESESGEPLVHWRLAAFRPFRASLHGSSREAICQDPTMGAGLPSGSPGVPVTPVRCGGALVLSDPSGCDAEAARTALLRELPGSVNTNRTPNGIALYQLASHIAANATEDLEPGQQNVIVLITDGLDTCECIHHAWFDFNVRPPGRAPQPGAWLRTNDASPDVLAYHGASGPTYAGWNAGLKAKAAYLALNGGDPDAGLGDIHVVGVAMTDGPARGYTNHLAWMASGGRHPAIYADRPEALRRALSQVLDEVTLPSGTVKLAAPRLATIKELVASSPSPVFPGSDPTLPVDALVVPANGEAGREEVIRRRAAYADNVLISTSADLHALRGGLKAFPTSPERGGSLLETSVWDAGMQLAQRDAADRLLLFNRAGSRELRVFEVGEVTPEDLGVEAGYLAELDGAGARTAEDAARIVVRLVRGEELGMHPDTGTIYRPDGRLHFTGGRGTWKLREGLASPAVVTHPPRRPDRVLRERESYERFFARHANRRTMVYLPTSGGVLHAFAADTGKEVFAYIPDDILGPAPGARGAGDRVYLRELAMAGVRGAAGLRRGLVNRFALAGSPVVRDVFLPELQDWRTLLAFGRSFGGRFVTALDVSQVGDGWAGGHRVATPPAGGPGLPRLLFNVGHRPDRPGVSLPALGETPAPLMVEVPAAGGSAWTMFQAAGHGDPDGDAGEWLLALSPEDGRVRGRYRLERAPASPFQKNGAVSSPAPWRPAWSVPGATDLVTRVYLADLHGQIHRLRLSEPGAPQWSVAHRLGGEHPIVTSPVVFPFPGRTEPHLLVVTEGGRRVGNTASAVVLLRDEGTRLQEVWRRTLADGETPQGQPVVLAGGTDVEVVLATHTSRTESLSCDTAATTDGIARLRAFNGLTGAPLTGVVAEGVAVRAFGAGRVRGISLSASGNMALSVSRVGGRAVDTIIGDFEFRVRDSALEDVTLFVEGFRSSPFWTRPEG